MGKNCGSNCGSKTEKPNSKADTTAGEEDTLGNMMQTDNNKTYSSYNYNALNIKTHQKLRKNHSYTMISYLLEKKCSVSIRTSKEDSSFVGVDTKGKLTLDEFDNLLIKINTTSITNEAAYDNFYFRITTEKNGETVNIPNNLNDKINDLINKKYKTEVNKILEKSNSSVKAGPTENNMTVDVKNIGSEKYSRGTIAKKIDDNKYDILYQNGEFETRVDKERIRNVDRIKTMSELVGSISKIINKVLKTQNKDSTTSTYSVNDVSSAQGLNCNCCQYDSGFGDYVCGENICNGKYDVEKQCCFGGQKCGSPSDANGCFNPCPT